MVKECLKNNLPQLEANKATRRKRRRFGIYDMWQKYTFKQILMKAKFGVRLVRSNKYNESISGIATEPFLVKVAFWLFLCHFCPLLTRATFFWAAEIDLILRINHHVQYTRNKLVLCLSVIGSGITESATLSTWPSYLFRAYFSAIQNTLVSTNQHNNF